MSEKEHRGRAAESLFLRELMGPQRRERCALVVSGSPRGAAPGLVARLASCAGFIAAVDSGADVAQRAGLTPDLLLGDFDSIDLQTLTRLRTRGIETVTYHAHKDATDLELMLNALRQRGFTTIIATNVLGGRIDHELAALGNLALMAEQGMKVIIVEQNESCVFLSARDRQGQEGVDDADGVRSASDAEGVRGVGDAEDADGVRSANAALKLDFASVPAPSFVSLIPWGGQAVVSIKGVEWELDHALLAPSFSRGVSNVVVAEQISLAVHEGTAMVVLENAD
jgi:thiamine pyrophosphokinase